MAARISLLLLSASSATALQVPARRAGSVVAPKTLRFVEVADRIQTSEDKAETFETADYLQDMDRYEGKNNVIPTGFDVNAAIDAAATESTTFIDVVVEETVAKVAEERKDEAAAVPMEEIEVGPVGEFLIKWGFKDDPRIPEDERIPAMQRIKDSGKAGVIA